MTMETELRDYLATPGHLDDWIRGWREGVMPIREQCGFQLLGAWVDPPRERFVWVLGYDGADGFDAAELRYHARTDRLALDPDPSSFVRTAQITRVAAVARDGA